MRNKIIIIIFIIVFFIALIFLLMKESNKIEIESQVEEVIPEEEISDDQLRSTIVTLYFKDKSTGNIMPEARNIDVKQIMNDPYFIILNLLIEGPLNENFEKCIPEGTKINNTYMEEDCLIIDFSDEFLKIEEQNETNQNIIINSILSTMTELREVNSIKILINGESNITLKNTGINLSSGFSIIK